MGAHTHAHNVQKRHNSLPQFIDQVHLIVLSLSCRYPPAYVGTPPRARAPCAPAQPVIGMHSPSIHRSFPAPARPADFATFDRSFDSPASPLASPLAPRLTARPALPLKNSFSRRRSCDRWMSTARALASTSQPPLEAFRRSRAATASAMPELGPRHNRVGEDALKERMVENGKKGDEEQGRKTENREDERSACKTWATDM